jgi:asparagine synthase (glutamine-hydrolysing)
MLAERARRLVPAPLRRLGRAALGGSGLESRVAAAASAGRWLDSYVESPIAAQLEPSSGWTSAWRQQLVSAETHERLAGEGALESIAEVLARAGDLSDPELHLYGDLHLQLPGGFLPKVDIGSSRVALEVRSPFLDFELVEFAARLPLELKLLGGRQKGLLRELATRYLPDEVVHGPKRGFAPKLDDWLRAGWSDLARELLEGSHAVAAGLFDARAVARVLDDHLEGRADHGQRLWTLICFEIWWRLFVDRTLSRSDSL